MGGGGCHVCEYVKIEDRYGNLFNKPVDGAFGEAIVSQISPAFQLDGLYGITDENEFQLNEAGSGTQSVDDNGLMTVSSGTTGGSFATLRSKRSVRYRPGQGSLARFTAMFPDSQVDGYQQLAGFINQSDILGVGFNYGDTTVFPQKRDEFAILRRQNSKAQVAQFTIDDAATLAEETIRITLNNEDFEVTIKAGDTSQNTAELGTAIYAGWIVDYFDNELFFLFNGPPTPLTGTFSISNLTGGGTLRGTYTELQKGAAPNDNWTYQSDFNLDKLDGTGPSKMQIDPTQLNVFQIDFRWLGAGRIRYSIEDPATGVLFPFHIDLYANRNTQPSISNPSLRIGYGVINAAPGIGTGTDVEVKGASMMGSIEGQVIRNVTTKSVSFTDTYNPGLTDSTEHCLLTLKNNRIATPGKPNVLNQRELIINSISAAIKDNGQSGDSILVYIYKNAASNPNALTYTLLDSLMSYSTTQSVINANQEGKRIGSFAVTSNSDLTIDLTPLRIILAPLDTLSIVYYSLNTITGLSMSINFEVE